MKITKYEHACVVIEEQGKRLVIDPGEFSESLPDLDNVVAVVITHIHFDHLNKPRLEKILARNPEAHVISVNQVKEELPNIEVCIPNSGCKVEGFELQYFGKEHAEIHPDVPIFENTGVMVNNSFYYAGDALTLPEMPVKVLAVPVSGPWAKTSELMDYMAAVKPATAFPTHDALNSEAGNASQDRWLTMQADKHGIKYQRLAVGESLNI